MCLHLFTAKGVVVLHVHTCSVLTSIQAVNVDAIYAAIPQIAVEKCPDMENQAQAVANKYGRALLLFSRCHNSFNSSKYFEDSDLSTRDACTVHVHI